VKKFILGFGTGLIAASAVLFIVYVSQPPKTVTEYLSDEEIMQRAKQLGMTAYRELPESAIQTTTATAETTFETTIETTSEAPDTYVSDVSVVIKPGMMANDVCKILQEKGIVSDYQDFHDYITERKATKKIRSGRFNIKTNLSNEELYNILIFK